MDAAHDTGMGGNRSISEDRLHTTGSVSRRRAGRCGRGSLGALLVELRGVLADWQRQPEQGSSAARRVHRQASTVTPGDFRGDPEPQAVAGSALGGDEWFKNLVALIGGNARSVVFDLDDGLAGGAERAQRGPRSGPAPQGGGGVGGAGGGPPAGGRRLAPGPG